MRLIGRLISVGGMRKAVWRIWYPFVTRRLRGEEVLFLNYAYEETPPMGIRLDPEDEKHRACIQLYHHVASQTPLHGKDILEVSCGHGGGAAYLARTFRPRCYTALDLNPEGISFCRSRHKIEGLSFVTGDAENLPFENSSFDALINVEASHCYPAFQRFLAEAARVLRPGGHLLYADFRFKNSLREWERALASAPFMIRRSRVINSEVLSGMECNSSRRLDLLARYFPRFMHSLGRDFAGVKGSLVHRSLNDGSLYYRSYCMERC